MKKAVGLWIDHRKTVIVNVLSETEEITEIASNSDRHIRDAGEGEVFSADDHRERHLMNHLGQYYDEVISRIRDVDAILILGPGEAKGEFVKRLQKENLGGNIVAVETVDKMTNRQIAARVRQHFIIQN